MRALRKLRQADAKSEAEKKLRGHRAQLPEWIIAATKAKGKKALALQKKFRFKKSIDGAKFCYELWKAAEKQGHHPDIILQYTRVTVT